MIINFGSINIDLVYKVEHLPQPGETISSIAYSRFLGGKGINHSIAISKAGGEIRHVGCVGQDGRWALEQISAFGVATNHITTLDETTGHAVIYVDKTGENCIVIVGGSNTMLTMSQVEEALATCNPKTDWVLLQNETNLVKEIVAYAKTQGYRVAYAAAPFIADIALELMDDIDLLCVNEGEAEALGMALGIEINDIPVPELLVTQGKKGCFYKSGSTNIHQGAFEVDAVDTTGAGDTFFGSFLAHYAHNSNVSEAMRYATAASALQVKKAGAATAIPEHSMVIAFLEEHKT